MDSEIGELKKLLGQIAEKVSNMEVEQVKSRAIADVRPESQQQRTTMFCWNYDRRRKVWMLKAVNRLKTNTCIGRFENLGQDESEMMRMISEDIEEFVRERIRHHGGKTSRKMGE